MAGYPAASCPARRASRSSWPLDADVEVVPVMSADDLQQGFGKLG
jgi:hypothetical protein